MKQPELTALIRSARTGDSQAQETLIREIQNRVYYHCKKMIKNESDAQDAAQDVLITVLTSLDKLREPAAFYGWVNGITANRCKHLLSQGVQEWQIPEDENGNSMLEDLEDLDQLSVPEAVLDNKETQRLMLEIIDALPPAQRMTVLFYYYDEMSIKEIAQAMETSEGTVKSRLSYARKSIKAGVEDLEKRGTKLYGIAPLPLLLLFMHMEAAQSGMSAAQRASLTASVLSAAQAGGPGTAAGSAVAGTTAAGGAAAKAGLSLGVKIAAAILAAAVAAGAMFAALHLAGGEAPQEPAPPVQVGELLPAPPEPPEEEEPAPEPPEPPEDDGVSLSLLALLNDIVYYGDPTQSKLTPDQAAVFAEVIRQETSDLLTRAKRNISRIGTCAALFDTGDGTPALFFGGGLLSGGEKTGSSDISWSNVGAAHIWEYRDGQAVPYAPDGQEPGGYWGQQLALRDGSLFIGGQRGSDGSKYDGGVYLLTGGTIPTSPQTSAGYELDDSMFDSGNYHYLVDGAEVSEEDFLIWQRLWENQTALCEHCWDGGAGGRFTGMGDAEAMEKALMLYATGGILPAPVPKDRPAYAPAYAQKVRELLLSGPDGCLFDLIDIDGDDVLELLVSYPEPGDYFLRANLYTANGTELCTLYDGLTAGLRGSGMYYYPGQNAVRLDTADVENSMWTHLTVYLQIDDNCELTRTDVTPAVSGEAVELAGTKTGDEMLSILEP